VREARPPYSPVAVVEEFAQLLRRYKVHTITGDRYAGEWPREAFRSAGIDYIVSELTRSELYGELIALVNAARIELLDQPRLLNQLTTLERRTGRSGKDFIDHTRGRHDDLSNVLAGVAIMTADMGLPPLPLRSCAREDSGLRGGDAKPCYLWWSDGDSLMGAPVASWIPSDNPPCSTCPGHRAVIDAWRRDAEGMDLREYRAVKFGTSEWIESRRMGLEYRRAVWGVEV
jgi:hypothetical protein